MGNIRHDETQHGSRDSFEGENQGEDRLAAFHVGYPDMIPAPRPRNAIDQLLTVMD